MAVAISSLCLVAIFGESERANSLATLALTGLGIAVVLGGIQVVWPSPTEREAEARLIVSGNVWWAVLLVALISALTCQTWFRSGTVIALGDVGLPNGAAWIARVFSPWAWSGSNLGGPSALEQQLPFAALLRFTQLVGSTAELAQRIWFTLLFAGAAVGSVALLLVLKIRPGAAITGALAYAYSPFVVANAVPNPVYMAALAMMPALMACVLAGATGRIRVRAAAVLLAISAPVLGYIDLNPPLLGTVIVTVVCSPIAALWLYGRAAAHRGVSVLALGLPIMIAISAYWIVPSALQLLIIGTPAQLTGIASWGWTEARATVLNALWLNTAWGWSYPYYYPFAPAYDSFPLSFLRFAPAILAFSALTVSHAVRFASRGRARLRLATLAASVAAVLLFLSTGTNPPGNVVFDRLYALPFGWLLREPGRFLIAADLMYAILIALSVERFLDALSRRDLRVSIRRSSMVVLPVALLVILPGVPLITGTIVPDTRPLLPPGHVRLPAYWTQIAAFVDKMPSAGAMLVLPPDDYYQMPYTWGYDGNDQFVTDLTRRSVLNPTTGYFSATDQLSNVVNLAAQSMLSGDWQLVDRLLGALGTPLVLVRGDLDTSYPGRTFLSPIAVANALRHAPNFDLVTTAGPLQLYSLRGASGDDSYLAGYYATVDSATPDLRVLSKLPAHAALISGPPVAGLPFVQEVPPVRDWQLSGEQLTWGIAERRGWSYDFLRLDKEVSGTGARAPGTGGTTSSSVQVTRTHDEEGGSDIRIAVQAKDILPNGSFQNGLWEPVGDCNNVSGAAAQPSLSATVFPQAGPRGGPFLRMSAQLDTACEWQPVTWHGGPVLVSMNLRHVEGADPQICLWETGPQRCADLPSPTARRNEWTAYSATIAPDPGTSALTLFVYARVYVAHTLTQNDYADLRVLELPSLPQVDLLATPRVISDKSRLMILHDAYSSGWTGPTGSKHVLVDGLTNGWSLLPGQSFAASYRVGDVVRAAFALSILGLLAIVVVAFSLVRWAGRLRNRDSREGGSSPL
jgi:arabinofuranan 3-O-arabinosyltransferase